MANHNEDTLDRWQRSATSYYPSYAASPAGAHMQPEYYSRQIYQSLPQNALYHYSSQPQQIPAQPHHAAWLHAPQHPQPTQAVFSPEETDAPDKPSLPSISDLLNMPDGDKRSQQATKAEPLSPQQRPRRQHQRHGHSASAKSQPSQSSVPPAAAELSQEQTLGGGPDHVARPYRPAASPPTPLLESEPPSNADAENSPSTVSSGSSMSGGPPYGVGMPSVAPQPRIYAAPPPYPHMVKPPPPPSIYTSFPYGVPTYMASPNSASPTYYSPDQALYPGLYHQRPLPTHFDPAMFTGMIPQFPYGTPYSFVGPSPMYHHMDTRDRHICPTCNKGFSRPSSLRIHSHSHTGERPFKCPRIGCGKCFSVRSNMKRHERGCHGEGPDMIEDHGHDVPQNPNM